MYKKILALCLSVALAMSTAMTPIFADGLSVTSKGDSGDKNILLALGKPDKTQNVKMQDILKKFKDSNDIDWAEKSIEKLGALGIINGIGNGLFKPNNNVTHAEAIAMVLKLTGQKEQAEAIKTQPEYFRGISDAWSWGYLQLALNEGIIVPFEDGKFDPKTPAKRHEIAKYIVRALDKQEEALANMNVRLSFKDSSAIPRNSVGYVYVISKLGIMQGSNNEFQPNKSVTRAEMAVLLDRAQGNFDDTIISKNDKEGIFVAYDKANSQITMNIDNKQVVYKVNSYAPVYRNNTYYLLDTLKPGDIIEVVLDSSNTIIFIEFKRDGSIPTNSQPLAIQHIQYTDLPQAIKDRVDALKISENYAAFRQDQYLYLVATRGQMSYGGYNVTMTNVSREATQTGKYNLKAVVEKSNPTGSAYTAVISYPYDVVKLAYFDGIEKVNFIDNANNLLSQTTIGALDNIQVINGTIVLVDASHRIIYIKESDNVIRYYVIPTGVQITLNNSSVALSALTTNMSLSITKTNGTITSLSAQTTANTIQTITGRISFINATNRIVSIVESNNQVGSYIIPDNVEITLNNAAITLSALAPNMSLTITKTNNVITKLAAQTTADTITGKIDSVDNTNRILYVKESSSQSIPYFIPLNVEIILNNTTVPLSALTANMNVTLTRTNNIITKVAAQTVDIIDTINGKIDSLNATTRIVSVKESDNVVRPYYIPTNVQITLNNTVVPITALAPNMTVTLTRTNSIITGLAATQAIEIINGRIDLVDTVNSIIKLLNSNNEVASYTIPANTQISLNNQTVTLSNLAKGMTAAITKVDGVITKLTVQNDIQTVEGILINVFPGTNNSTIEVRIGNENKTYVILPETAVFLDNVSISIQAMPRNYTIIIKIINGIVTEVRNK